VNGEEFQRVTGYFGAGGACEGQVKKFSAQGMIKGPPAVCEGGPGLWQVISKRRSRRDFKNSAMPLADLFQLRWATQGITGQQGRRAAPSAGHLHPLDTYLVAGNVAELQAGLYRLRPQEGDLELLETGEELGHRLSEAALGQSFVAAANVSFIWAAVPERSTWKYGERSYRYFYLDAGHICHALYLAATALGYGACGVGAFMDDAVNGLLGLDGRASFAVYAAAVGSL